MKKIVLALGVVMLALVAVPWVFGALAQQRLAADVERLDAESELDAAVVDYARGWGTSTATVELDLAQQGAFDPAQLPPETPPEIAALLAQIAEPLRLEITLRHGPVLLGDGATLGLMATTVHLDPSTPGYRDLLEELGIPYFFELRAVTRFDGRSEWVNEVPAFMLERGDLVATFSGSRAAGTYDPATRRVEGTGEAASLRVETADARLELQGLDFASDSTRYDDRLRLGFAEGSIARLSVTAPGEALTLENLSARFDLNLEDGGDQATMSGRYALARLSDGADIDVSDVEITATAEHVDIGALSAYYAGIQAAGLQNDASAPMSLAVEDALYDLMTASPAIELAPVSLAWNGEPLDATVRIEVDGTNLPPRSNFTALVLAFQGVIAIDASIELSEALANTIATQGLAFQVRRGAAQDGVYMTDDEVQTLAQAQASIALAQLVAQGMLTNEGGHYSTTAQFSQGELTVNGTAIPLGLR